MASPKKRINPLFVALAVVLVAVVVAVGVVFFQLHSKISALQTGASFTFRYEIAPNSPDKPPLLNILERVNASSGSISGQYAPGKLQLSFYQLNEDDSVKTSPFTRVYIDSEETLFDIGQLYTVLRQAVTDKLSIASVLLPEWSLGDYISQTQASAVLGVETNKVELQELSGFTLSLKGLKKVSPSAARDGYRYYQFPAAADGTTLVLTSADGIGDTAFAVEAGTLPPKRFAAIMTEGASALPEEDTPLYLQLTERTSGESFYCRLAPELFYQESASDR